MKSPSPTSLDVATALAVAELVGMIRQAEGPPWFQLQITRKKGGWTVSTTHLDGSGSSVGRGESFAEAWRRQDPSER